MNETAGMASRAVRTLVRMASFAFGDPDHGLREVANKARAFERFRAAPSRAPDDPDAAPAAVRGLDPWDAVWVKEGLGFHWAAGGYSGEDGAAPRDLELPDDWLLPAHTGAGLVFALQCLDGLAWRAGDAEVRTALDGFAGRCARSSREGWRQASAEALGLVARTLQHHRIEALDRLSSAVDPTLRRAFWHGLGRGGYFTPTEAVPFLARPVSRRLEAVAEEAPDDEARDQAVAGWAWALTLVNLRHPAVIAGSCASRLADSPAFADGVASALAVWRASGGGDGRIRDLLAHRPEDPVGAWAGLVDRCGRAAERLPTPGTPLGGLFVYRPGRWRERAPFEERRTAA